MFTAPSSTSARWVSVFGCLNSRFVTRTEYVLSWRWDCELTAQVWNACSDVTIVKA